MRLDITLEITQRKLTLILDVNGTFGLCEYYIISSDNSEGNTVPILRTRRLRIQALSQFVRVTHVFKRWNQYSGLEMPDLKAFFD